MERERIKELMNQILARQGKPPLASEQDDLRNVGFRSLDFSELALRVEREVGRELNFDAALIRSIATVADVVNFFEHAAKNV
jgi:acyl carrier protein